MTQLIPFRALRRPNSRRSVLCGAAGMGLAVLPVLGRIVQAEPAEDRGQASPANAGKSPGCLLPEARARIVEEAYRLGYEYEKQRGSCSQCTLAALQDAVPFLDKDPGLFRGAGALDGGATPGGTQNCGSFTGAGMAIGYLCGRERCEEGGKFEGSNGRAHQLIRKLYKHYEKRYGTVLCGDVREKANRDCPEVCGLAAKWTAQILVDEFCQPPRQQPAAKEAEASTQEPD